MSERYINIIRWSNIGVQVHLDGVIFLTPWGNLIIKPWADRLFSERYGYTPHLKVLGWCVTWRRLRAFAPPSPQSEMPE